MQLGRCCKCGKTICEGYWLRPSVITSVTLDDTGLEEVAWDHITSSYANYYQIDDSAAVWAAGTKKLAYGIRYDTSNPTANNQEWAAGGIWTAPPTASVNNTETSRHLLNYMAGVVKDVSYAEASNFYIPPNYLTEDYYGYPYYYLVANSPLRLTCHPKNHATSRPVSELVVIYNDKQTNGLYVPFGVRPRYFRFLENGSPVTDILSIIPSTGNYKVFKPVSDVTKTGWTGVGSVTNLYLNVDTYSDDGDYNWCASGVRTITHAVYNADYATPWEKTAYKVKCRIARCDNTGAVLGSGTPGNTFDVTIRLKNASTTFATFTQTVPADITTYEFSLSDAECLAVTPMTTLRLEFVTTDSGGSGSDNRGLVIYGCSFEIPDETSALTIPFDNQDLFRNDSDYQPKAFTIPEEYRTFSLRKGKRFGVDVWYELIKQDSIYQSRIRTGPLVAPTSSGYSPAVGGSIGVKLEYAASFGIQKHTYQLTFSGGTYRPWSCIGDTLTFFTNDAYVPWSPGVQMEAKVDINACWLYLNSMNSIDNTEISYLHDETQLTWASEVPILKVNNHLYEPEDTDGTSVGQWYVNNPASATGYGYRYVQSPSGGFWKSGNSHTFVPAFGYQIRDTNAFTNIDAAEWPDSVTVTRIPRKHSNLIFCYANASGYPYTTWTTPAESLGLELTEFVIECWGAGGGGAGITREFANGTGDVGYPGGAGGGAYSRSVLTLPPSTTYRLYIGQGGTRGGRGHAAIGEDGSDGEETSFRLGTDILVSAAGGKKGTASAIGGSGTAGVGGAAADGIGDVKYSGGNGNIAPSALMSGGGGGSAGYDSDGNNATVNGFGIVFGGLPVKNGGYGGAGSLGLVTRYTGPGGGGSSNYVYNPGSASLGTGASGAIRISWLAPYTG